MSPGTLSDDSLLALVHEIRAILRRSQPVDPSPDKKPFAHPPASIGAISALKGDVELELLLGRVSDYASACYLSKARPLPLEVAIQCAALNFPQFRIDVTCDDRTVSGRLVPVEMVKSFSELMDNAIKFSRGATVEVTVKPEPAGACSIVVADRGVGLPADQVERVFDFLTRMHSRDDFPGFGLGLPIARRICEAAGASIRLSGNASGGVSAEVRFPLA